MSLESFDLIIVDLLRNFNIILIFVIIMLCYYHSHCYPNAQLDDFHYLLNFKKL